MSDHYGTVEGFIEYCAERGITPSVTDEDEIASALLVVSEWLDAVYSSSFTGTKVGGRSQAREWPRHYAVDSNGEEIPQDEVPIEMAHAAYEATLKHTSGETPLIQDFTQSKYVSASVSGAVSVTYNTTLSVADVQTKFMAVAMAIAPLLAMNKVVNGLSGAVFR